MHLSIKIDPDIFLSMHTLTSLLVCVIYCIKYLEVHFGGFNRKNRLLTRLPIPEMIGVEESRRETPFIRCVIITRILK